MVLIGLLGPGSDVGRPAGEFYNIRERMVLVEITLRETYRKLAGFYPFAEGALSAAVEALIYRPGNFGATVSGTGFLAVARRTTHGQ
jgi:hypothetical protein